MYVPTMTSHSGFLTRSSSDWGSRRLDMLTLLARRSLQRCGCRMKDGLSSPLDEHLHPQLAMECRDAAIHLAVRSCPRDGREIELDLAMARTSADADMLTRNSAVNPISTCLSYTESFAIC